MIHEERTNANATWHAVAAFAPAHGGCFSAVVDPGTRRMDRVRAAAAGELCGEHSRLLPDHAHRLHPPEPCAVYDAWPGRQCFGATHAGQCSRPGPPASF